MATPRQGRCGSDNPRHEDGQSRLKSDSPRCKSDNPSREDGLKHLKRDSPSCKSDDPSREDGQKRLKSDNPQGPVRDPKSDGKGVTKAGSKDVRRFSSDSQTKQGPNAKSDRKGITKPEFDKVKDVNAEIAKNNDLGDGKGSVKELDSTEPVYDVIREGSLTKKGTRQIHIDDDVSESSSNDEITFKRIGNVDRTYENGDSNNNLVDDDNSDEKVRIWDNRILNAPRSLLLKYKGICRVDPNIDDEKDPNNDRIKTICEQPRFRKKIESATLVRGNAPSSGNEGSSERSNSDVEPHGVSERISKVGIRVYPTTRYVPLSRKSGTSDSASEKEVPFSKKNEAEKIYETRTARDKKEFLIEMLVKKMDISSSESISAEDILPLSDLSEKQEESSSSDLTPAEGIVAGLYESGTSDGGLTSSEDDLADVTMISTQKQVKKQPTKSNDTSEPQGVSSEGEIKKVPPKPKLPLRQASYKQAVGIEIFPPLKNTPVPASSHKSSADELINPDVQVKKEVVKDKKVLPPKKPFVRKISYEMAVRGGEITPSPKMRGPKSKKERKLSLPHHFKPIQSLSGILCFQSKEDDKNSSEDSTERILFPKESEESFTESTSLSTTPQNFSSYEKILPLGDLLTVAKDKPQSVSSGSRSGSIYSLPWDAPTPQLLTKAPSIETVSSVSSSSQTRTSSSTPILELIHIIKDNVTDDNLTIWLASVEDILGLSSSNSVYREMQTVYEEPRSLLADRWPSFRSMSVGEEKKNHSLDTHKIPGLLEIIWMKYLNEYTYEMADEKFQTFLSQCSQYADYWRQRVSRRNPHLASWIGASINTPLIRTAWTDKDSEKEAVARIRERLRSLADEREGKIDTKDTPYDDMMKIMLSNEILNINEHILHSYKESKAKKPKQFGIARRFRIDGEVILLEDNLPVCQHCSVVSIQILWARQMIARLNNTHVYANVPPYAENLTIIKRILSKVRQQLMDDMASFETFDADFYTQVNCKPRIFKVKSGVKRRKNSRRNVRTFVKGAIEVIPELEEEHLSETERNESDVKEKAKPAEIVAENKVKEKSKRKWTLKSDNTKKVKMKRQKTSVKNVPPISNDKVVHQIKNLKKEPKKHADKTLFKSSTKQEAKPIETTLQDLNTDNSQHRFVWQFDQPQPLENYSVRISKGEIDAEIAQNTQTRTYHTPWWKMKRPSLIRRRPRRKKIKFPSVPLSMNLVQHENGRLEVIYGGAQQYPFTVGEYSFQDGRFLTLEEIFLKKYQCYQPPVDYFFRVGRRNTNLTVIRLSKKSNFFLPTEIQGIYYPPVYGFRHTDKPGMCPLQKCCKKKFIRNWFTKVAKPALSRPDRGFELEMFTPPAYVLRRHPYFGPSKIPPPPVGPKPKKEQKPVIKTRKYPICHKGCSAECNFTEKLSPPDIPTGIVHLKAGKYIYCYEVNGENKQDLFLKIVQFEIGPPCVSVHRKIGHPILKVLADKYLSNNDYVILGIQKAEKGRSVERYNLVTFPPSRLDKDVNEYVESDSGSYNSLEHESETGILIHAKERSRKNYIDNPRLEESVPLQTQSPSNITPFDTSPKQFSFMIDATADVEHIASPDDDESDSSSEDDVETCRRAIITAPLIVLNKSSKPNEIAHQVKLNEPELRAEEVTEPAKTAKEPSLQGMEYLNTYPWSYPSTSRDSPALMPIYDIPQQIGARSQSQEKNKIPQSLESIQKSEQTTHHSSTSIPVPGVLDSDQQKPGPSKQSDPNTSRHSTAQMPIYDTPQHIETRSQSQEKYENPQTLESIRKSEQTEHHSARSIALSEVLDYEQQTPGPSKLSEEVDEPKSYHLLKETRIPEWYLPDQETSESSLSRENLRLQEPEKRSETPPLMDTEESEPIYANWFVIKEWERRVTQDRIMRERRKSTGDAVAYYELLSLSETTKARFLRSQRSEGSLASNIQQRLRHISEIHERYPFGEGRASHVQKELSPSQYSLRSEASHTPRMRTSASRHSIGTSNLYPLSEFYHPEIYPRARSFGTSPIQHYPTERYHPRMYRTISRQDVKTNERYGIPHSWSFSDAHRRTSRQSIRSEYYEDKYQESPSSWPLTDHLIYRPLDYPRYKARTDFEEKSYPESPSTWPLNEMCYPQVYPSPSRESIGNLSENMHLSRRYKPNQAKIIDKNRAKYRSRSSESIGQKILRPFLKDDQRKHSKSVSEIKLISRSNEEIAERMAHHYLVDYDAVKLKDLKYTEKTMKVKRQKSYRGRYISRSSDDIAQRMAYHYIVREFDDSNIGDTSLMSSRTTISSRTCQSCPVHGQRSLISQNVSDVPEGPVSGRARSTPFLWCGGQSPQDERRIDSRNSPLWKNIRSGRTRTV